jgi:hypothetical protein
MTAKRTTIHYTFLIKNSFNNGRCQEMAALHNRRTVFSVWPEWRNSKEMWCMCVPCREVINGEFYWTKVGCEGTAFLSGLEKFNHSEFSWENCSCVAITRELLWLMHGNNSRYQSKENLCHWKPLPEDWWRHSRLTRLNARHIKLYSVHPWTSVVTWSYVVQSGYPYEPRL